MTTRSVLFVCLGNICRSPTAEGVFRKQLELANMTESILVDSAGTGDWHVGNPPDPRAQQAAREHGFDISDLRARQATAADFERFDYVIAMDHSNRHNLMTLTANGGNIPRQQAQNKIRMMLSFANQTTPEEVPDPYYGGDSGFDDVIELIENAAAGLLDTLKRELAAS